MNWILGLVFLYFGIGWALILSSHVRLVPIFRDAEEKRPWEAWIALVAVAALWPIWTASAIRTVFSRRRDGDG